MPVKPSNNVRQSCMWILSCPVITACPTQAKKFGDWLRNGLLPWQGLIGGTVEAGQDSAGQHVGYNIHTPLIRPEHGKNTRVWWGM